MVSSRTVDGWTIDVLAWAHTPVSPVDRINATVMGSKGAKEGEDGEAKEEGGQEEVAAEEVTADAEVEAEMPAAEIEEGGLNPDEEQRGAE